MKLEILHEIGFLRILPLENQMSHCPKSRSNEGHLVYDLDLTLTFRYDYFIDRPNGPVRNALTNTILDDEPLDMIVTKRTDNRGPAVTTPHASDDEKTEENSSSLENTKTEGPEKKEDKSSEEPEEKSSVQKKPRSALESICAKLNEKMKKEEVKNEEVKAEDTKMKSEDSSETKSEQKPEDLKTEELTSEVLEKKNEEIRKLKEELKREKLERELIEKDQNEIGQKFEEKVEQFKKREFYRPHSTYRGILKE